MKKLVLFMAIATAVAFASCANEEKPAEEATEPQPEATEQNPAENVVDDQNAENAENVENVENAENAENAEVK